MHRTLKIFSTEILSKRSGIPEKHLLKWKDLTSKDRKRLFFDHSDSEPEKWKYIRVVKNQSLMEKFHIWIGEELKEFDSYLPENITWGVSKKSVINAMSRHIRKKGNCFIKSDISRFFESIPRERVYSLFCNILQCSPEVAEIITNTITFPPGSLKSPEDKPHTLARWLHVSSRVAIWASIQFFKKLQNELEKKYKRLKPRITFYVDDIGISLLTTDLNIAKEVKEWILSFTHTADNNINFLTIHPEKTQYSILLSLDEYVEYLGGKIYINRTDISEEGLQKSKDLYSQFLQEKDLKKKANLWKQIHSKAIYRKRIKSVSNKQP